MAKQTFFESLGRLSSTRPQINILTRQLNAAGFDISAEAFAGFLAINVILLTFVITFFALGYIGDNKLFTAYSVIMHLLLFIILLFLTYILTMMTVSAILMISSDARKRSVETALPDFMLLTSANIKAGMALDQALWYSAKDEFGLLSTEIKIVIKRAFSGESLESALDKLAERFDSKIFTRTISLIKQASATGGEIATVLERASQDMRNSSLMKKEVAASLVLYEIFILFASVFATPFLFAAAGKLIKVFEQLRLSFPSSSEGFFGTGPSFGSSSAVINSSDFFVFSMATMIVTALFSSFIIGVIRTGSKNDGLKYFPFIAFLSYIIYFIVDGLITSIFFNLGG